MNFQVISTENEFRKLAKKWNKLSQKIKYTTPYQSWEWNYLYWRQFGKNKKLQILVASKEGILVGIFPLWIRRQNNITIAEPIGTRGSDYMHFIVISNFKMEAICLFTAWFVASEIDVLNLEDVPVNVQYLSTLIEYAEKNFIFVDFNKKYCPCYEIRLPSNWSKYLNTLSKRRKKDTLYYQRYVDRYFEKIQVGSGNIGEIGEHFKLHQKIRNIRGDKGSYANKQVISFMREFVLSMNDANKLDLQFLALDGKPAASILAVNHNRVKYLITIGHDPDFAKFRPGTVLYSYHVQSSIEEGSHAYDLSRGPDPYKIAMGAVEKYNARLVISKYQNIGKQYLGYQTNYWKNRGYEPTDW